MALLHIHYYIRNDSFYIEMLVSLLQLQFDRTDLGLEIIYTTACWDVFLKLNAQDPISRYGMFGSKPCHTPVALKLPTVHIAHACSSVDSQNYWTMIVATQYLTFSRPDIAFLVSRLSQFMHTPMLSHVITAKHIL